MKWHHKSLIFVFLVIFIGLLIGTWRENHMPQNSNLNLVAATSLPQPRTLPNFKLTNADGESFSNKQFHNNWSFLFFGYTDCPGICPATLGKLDEMATLLGPARAQFVFITIDPKQDTPKQLKTYFSQKQYSHAHFLAATGEHADIKSLAKTIGIYIAKENIPLNGHIEHSGTVLLINPEGKLAAVFTSPDNPQGMARDFKTLVHRYHQGQNV